VHDVFDVSPSSYVVGSAADHTQLCSLFVIIGKALDRDSIEEGLLSCRAR
jgi:hypothetical protein